MPSSQQVQRAVDGQRVEHVSVTSGHSLGHKERVQRSFFCGLGHGLEESVDGCSLRPERPVDHHLDWVSGPLIAPWDSVRRGKRYEDLAATVVAHRTGAT